MVMGVVELPLPFGLYAVRVKRESRIVADDADFNHFFLANYDPLVRALTAMTGDRERASDCVQEAFIRAYARWGRVRRYQNPKFWVRRVAINLMRDANRSESRRKGREERTQASSVASVPAPPDSVVADINLLELLESLTPQQRAVAALFYVEDLPINEIAGSLELSTGAVKFHLNQARNSLRTLLDSEEVLHG